MWCYCKQALRWLYYSLATIIISMALASIVLSLLLPLAERQPAVIARWLSERAGLPVHFDHLNTGWSKRGPLLQLDGLRIGVGEDAVHIAQAEILIAQYSGLLPGRSFSELRLRGLHLVLERLQDGRWQVRGISGQAGSDSDPLSALGRLGELQVIGAQLGIIAPALGMDTTIPDVDLRLRVDGSRTRIALSARMHPEAAPLRGVLDLDRNSGNARAHASIAQTDLAIWSPLLRLDGLMLASGEGQIAAWAELKGFRLFALTTDANFGHLVLQRIAQDDKGDAVAFGQVDARLFWRNEAGQWQLSAPQLRIGDPAAPQILDGLMLAGGPQLALRATRIDAGPLLAIAALSPRLPSGVRDWLKAAKPDASAHDIQLSGTAAHGVRGSLRVTNLHFASADEAPGVSGLSGAVRLDMQGAMLELTPDAVVQFDWPRGFGVPHHLKLDGTLAAWWTGAEGGVHLMTPALRVDADSYAANVRGGLWFHTDGRRPRIDMVAALDATDIAVAKRFWVRSQMPAEAIDWLDMALVSGSLQHGRALVSGELADWPFDQRDGDHVLGVFEAQGELGGARLRFQPDWPLMEEFNGPIRFFNDGFSLSGKARLGAITLHEVKAALAHYSQDDLTIHSRASGDLNDWLSLLKQSPLYADNTDVLDNLSASGAAASTFAMTLPLGTGRGPRIQGEIELDGARLSEQRFDLHFSDVRGPVEYSQTGFASGALSATQAGQMGILNLRAGAGHVREAGHAFEAELQMELAATDLIQRVPELDWLAPHLSGRSRWTVALTVAEGSAGTGRLSARSDLIGTTLGLPAPLGKPAAVPLQAEVHTTIPWEDGEVQVRLGERLSINARSHAGRTGIGIVLGPGDHPPSVPTQGLVISGHAHTLDASAWASIGNFGGPDNAPAPAPVLNLDIGQLHLMAADFAEVALRTDSRSGGTILHIDAPAISGSVHWPAAPDTPLKAELARLYWPPLSAPSGPGDHPAPASPSNTQPRDLPPLDLHIHDLRLGDTALGEADLRTQRTETGLEIEHFRIHGGTQTVAARGAWRSNNGAVSTRLELDVDSRDIGQLLAGLGLGLGQQLKGGVGSLRLQGHWPASPMDFSSAQLTGSMSIALRDGQLLEVEPGAGRVLGLLSVAQLPRRLLLDFRDFFGKGFGFNDISGEIQVAEGIARTDGLRINGPAAKIRISGSSHLVAQTHDQQIEVLPRTGNLLTVVGAFAGGPLGAAVGAAANAAFKGPLSVGAKIYRVTGPWQEPKVEVASLEVVNEADSEAPSANAAGEAIPAESAAPPTPERTQPMEGDGLDDDAPETAGTLTNQTCSGSPPYRGW